MFFEHIFQCQICVSDIASRVQAFLAREYTVEKFPEEYVEVYLILR